MWLVFAIWVVWYSGKKESKPRMRRIITQSVLTAIFGFLLAAIGKAEFSGGLEAMRRSYGFLGMPIFYGSWLNLYFFLTKLPRRTG